MENIFENAHRITAKEKGRVVVHGSSLSVIPAPEKLRQEDYRNSVIWVIIKLIVGQPRLLRPCLNHRTTKLKLQSCTEGKGREAALV